MFDQINNYATMYFAMLSIDVNTHLIKKNPMCRRKAMSRLLMCFYIASLTYALFISVVKWRRLTF